MYVKIDRERGKILSHKQTPGPYKGVPIARKKRYTDFLDIKPSCKYCYHFDRAVDRAINETDDKEAFSRHCEIINKRITSESESCKRFVANTYFWCDSCGYRVAVEACLGRETCHCCDTKKCDQRELLEHFMKGEDE